MIPRWNSIKTPKLSLLWSVILWAKKLTSKFQCFGKMKDLPTTECSFGLECYRMNPGMTTPSPFWVGTGESKNLLEFGLLKWVYLNEHKTTLHITFIHTWWEIACLNMTVKASQCLRLGSTAGTTRRKSSANFLEIAPRHLVRALRRNSSLFSPQHLLFSPPAFPC